MEEGEDVPMTDPHPLLRIRFDGSAVGPGTIPVSHLLYFLTNLNKALQRIGRVLHGEPGSVRRGRPARDIESEVELKLVSLTEGSPAAVLGFERTISEPYFPGMDSGWEILERALHGLKTIQSSDEEQALPSGYDSGVLMAWRDAGKVFGQGIDRISFTLEGHEAACQIAFTPDGVAQIRERIRGPQLNFRTIEGRLLMADFKDQGTRCRIHPSVGDPILCLFSEEQKDDVLGNILHYVRIFGEAKEDAETGKIASITIRDIDSIEEKSNEDTDLLPKGTSILQSFWESPALQELANSQGVQPVADVRTFSGTWPGDKDDGFEAAIDELRRVRG